MLLREQDVRNHRLDGCSVVHVAEDQDVTLVTGAQDTVITVREQETVLVLSMALLRLYTRFLFSTCSMILMPF